MLSFSFLGCQRKDGRESESIPTVSTNAILAEIENKVAYSMGRTNSIADLVRDLENKLSKYALQTKTSNELQQLEKQLEKSHQWEDLSQVGFYQKLKELSLMSSNFATNAIPIKRTGD